MKQLLSYLLLPIFIFTGCTTPTEEGPVDEASLFNSTFSTPLVEVNLTGVSRIVAFDTQAGLKDVRTGGLYMVPNDINDFNSSWDIIQVYFQDYKKNIEIVVIDGDTGVLQKYYADGAAFNGMHNVIAPNGKLFFVSGKADGTIEPQLNVYDPVSNEMRFSVTSMPTDMDGATYNAIQIGTDGSMFMSGMHNVAGDDYHKPRVLEINTTDYSIISDSGPLAVRAQPWKVAADAKYVYLLTGKIPWKVIQYPRDAPEEAEVVASKSRGLNILQTAFGVVLEDTGKHYFMYEGAKIEALHPTSWKNATPPWPYPERYDDFDIWWTLNQTHNIVDQLLKRPQVSPYGNMEKVATTKIVRSNAEPIHGQAELWIQQPKESRFTKYEYNLSTYPTTLNRLAKMADGKIIAGSSGYGPYLVYDTDHNTYAPSAGSLNVSMYTMLEHEKKIYMAGYPRGVLYEYDPSKPWTQGVHDYNPDKESIDLRDESLNPRWCGQLGNHGSGAHKIYGSAKGADGLLYFGGQWMRDGNGGGLAWYDPQNGEMGGISEPFVNFAIQHLTPIGHYIAISTVAVTSLDGYKPKNARLFLFDTIQKKIVKSLDPMAGYKVSITGQIIASDDNHIVGFSKDAQAGGNTIVYKIDIRTGKLDYRFKVDKFGFEHNFAVGRTLAKNSEGKIIAWLGWKVIAFDADTQEIEVLAQFDHENRQGVQGDMVLDGDDIYIARFNTLLKLERIYTQ